ncbi:MAG: hypothetical protein LQ338_004617, partial [Usnochroma carphineum]
MLDAFERWNARSSAAEADSSPGANNFTWEERYVMLLWLSHLTQTPFDLASISSTHSTTHHLPVTLHVGIGFPSASTRLLALALRYIVSASKEQEAARMLSVRLCMRPDMVRLNLPAKLIDWMRQPLKALEDGSQNVSIYTVTGVLSFLAGFFKSCDSSSVAPFLLPILELLQDIIASRTSHARIAYGSAAVRKLMIKIHRASAMHLLSGCPLSVDNEALLGNIIDHLMTCLGDKDNPIRFAASKALSVIAQRLDLEMKEQLLDATVERLQDDVALTGCEGDNALVSPLGLNKAAFQQNLSTADPLQWQGLILTLSHLLFRHAVPQRNLAMVVGLLMNALDFEQRSSTGASIGSGVRDAACFGMWSLARKYPTGELLEVAASEVRPRSSRGTNTAVFELLASGLVLTATLDPEGNIRRAASAALQELVGRHPQKIPYGIDLVQIVDYQAVGLRSRAMNAVGIEAATLDNLYLYAICDGLLSWRAINSPDAAIRRQAACIVGEMFRLHGPGPLSSLQQRIQSVQVRSLEEWHGLYLAFAAIFRQDPSVLSNSRLVQCDDPPGSKIYLLRRDAPLSEMDITTAGKNANLAAEALCTIVSALAERSTGGTDLKTLEYHLAIIESSFEHAPRLPLRGHCGAPLF